MKCDFSKEGVLRSTKKSEVLYCDKEASQFLLIAWKGMSPWAKARRVSPPKLVARCVDHMIVGAADRQDLKAISEQEAIVFKIHEE